ncbi:GGDEF domain-containing protein [Thalassomonas sp. M1454]|uniref:tetratricopeptide repeat-containing diguanylate cyclase n=1 Tax=Thalassomonas sp. M1454 TaxID=2594477 RepID=UPI00163D6848|nr:GGDEF domain-containing protein [Thalassomonas sp. M1454]
MAITGFSQAPLRPINDIYYEAIAVKSSDPDLSQELLFKLNYRRDELTEAQRIELVYLTGYLETMRGKYYRALDVHEHLTLSDKPHIVFRAYANMLQIKMLMRDYGGAAEYVPKILAIMNDDSASLPSNTLHNTLIGLIGFYNQLGQFEQALPYIEKLFSYSLTPREQCFANAQRTQIEVKLGKITLTDESILSTKNLCLSIGEEVVVQNYIADLALIYIEQQQYQGAINLINTELERSNAIYSSLNKAEYNAYLACSYMHLGDLVLAKKYALETLNHVANIKEPLPKTWAYDVLYEHALAHDNHLEAIEYLKLYSAANDELTQIVHLKALGIEQGNQGLKPIEKDVSLYKKRLKLNDAMQAVEQEGNISFRRYRLIQITLEVLFLLFIGYQFYSMYRVRQSIKLARKNLAYDPTTKAFQRHAFISKAEDKLSQQQSENTPCGLLIFNIDDMNRINLIHNSDRGDWVIKHGLQACLNVCTKGEIIGRLGGDEFAILIPERSLPQIKSFANKILTVFQQLDTSKVSYRFDSFCSIGLTSTQTSGYQLKDLIKDADVALRSAKAQGKNRVVYFDQLAPHQ